MPFIRPNALRSLQSSLRYSGARVTARAAPARTQLVARRYASSGGHGDAHGEPSSDMPWLLAALVITPPSCWYLWPDASHAEHHGDHGAHAEHEEHEEEPAKEEEEPQEEAAPAEEKGEEDKKGEEEKPAKSEESKDTSDEKEQTKDEEPAKESDEKPEEKSEEKAEETEPKEQTKDNTKAQGKGKLAEDSAGQENSRKLESSSKGGTKTRLDSGLGKNLGQGSSAHEGDREAQSKSDGDMIRKQKGMSNTDTRHSIQIDAPGSEKSTKGSGAPETAKHKGTVDHTSPLK